MLRKYSLGRDLPFGVAVAVACLLFLAGGAKAQAPPGLEPDAPTPKLNLQDLLGSSNFGADRDHVSLAASFRVEKETRRGVLTVAVKIDPGWHIYSLTQPVGGPMKSQVSVAKSDAYVVLGGFQPDRPPHILPPKVFPVNSEEHTGDVNWSALFELNEGVDAEKLTIDLTANGQVCGDGEGGVCIPFSQKLTAKFAGYIKKGATPGEFRPDEGQAQLNLKGHVEPAAVARGGKARLVITAEPNPGWHVYAYGTRDPDMVGANKPTLIHLAPLTGWTRSPTKVSAPPIAKPAEKGLPEQRYHGEPVTWTIDLNVAADAPLGEVVLSGYVGFQTCDEKSCLPPQAVQFRASIPVKITAEEGRIPLDFELADQLATGDGKSVAGYSYVAKLVATNPAPTGEINWKALFPMIGFGLLGGLILNLMPCVLPVIGLKLMSFVQQGGHSRGTIFALNVWFALGLMSVFLILATAAAFANLGWGQQFTYTWFKVSMVVLVFAFALSFLGVWEVPIPGFAQTSSSSKLQIQEGPAGAFFKGIFTTLLATPCSGPFLGPVFGFTLTQPPLATYIIFASVGVGMASPYLVIGAFPSLVRWLPKPGHWMETVKHLMGFVLLGTVVYLFSTINKDFFIPTLALVMGVWLACWIIGQVPIYEELNKQVRQWGLGLATACAVGWFSFTYLTPQKHLYEWQPFAKETIAKLQAEGKTVMVDFTADWCATCQTNFLLAINTQKVKEVVEKNGVAPVLADWTDHNESIKNQLAELNSASIPLLAIYPANKPDEVIVLRDAITQNQLLAALEQAGPSADANSDTLRVSSMRSQSNPTGN